GDTARRPPPPRVRLSPPRAGVAPPPVTELIAFVQEGAMAEFTFATYLSANACPRPATSAVSEPTCVGIMVAIVDTPAKALINSGMIRSGVIPQLLSMTTKLTPPFVPARPHDPADGSSPHATSLVE